MRCPYCKADQDRVIDSRATAEGSAIRRRRQCLVCDKRYTTFERAESAPLRVVKKGGARAAFDRQKVLRGLSTACEKRPVSSEQLDAIVERVERKCLEAFDKEVPSTVIGKLIMEELIALDEVAYVRFASVYREFQDIREFEAELRRMRKNAQATGHPVPRVAASREGVVDAKDSTVSDQKA